MSYLGNHVVFPFESGWSFNC